MEPVKKIYTVNVLVRSGTASYVSVSYNIHAYDMQIIDGIFTFYEKNGEKNAYFPCSLAFITKITTEE